MERVFYYNDPEEEIIVDEAENAVEALSIVRATRCGGKGKIKLAPHKLSYHLIVDHRNEPTEVYSCVI